MAITPCARRQHRKVGRVDRCPECFTATGDEATLPKAAVLAEEYENWLIASNRQSQANAREVQSANPERPYDTSDMDQGLQQFTNLEV